MGAAITLAIGVVVLGVPFDPLAVNWPLLAVVMALGLEAIVVIGVILAAVCLQTRQEAWSYPEAVAGALFLISGAVFPLSVLPMAIQAIGLANPLTWWLEGVRHALFPPARVRSVAPAPCSPSSPGRPPPTPRPSSSPCSRPGPSLHSERPSRSAGASDAPGIAGSSTRRRAPDGSDPSGRPGTHRRTGFVRIYEGSPRQDFEEVFRSIGAFLDQRSMKEVLLAEAPDGFIVQGLVSSGVDEGAWSETMGTQTKETLTFLDDDIARFMEEAVARRNQQAADDWTRAGYYEKAFRVLGRYMDEQKPRDTFFFEQDGAFVVRLLMAGPKGSHHVLAEFTREDIDAMIAQGPALRDTEHGPGKTASG